MKNFGEKNIIFKRLVIFAIAAFMWSSTIGIVSVADVVIVPSGAPPPDPVVDGVISPGEYDDALYIPLTGPWPPDAPFPPSLVDCYVYWDTQYLWIAVDEPVPNWGGGSDFIEFMWDAGPSSPNYYHAWVLFSDGNWQYVRCGKPTGCWGWAADPFPGTSWWATGTATEFKIDYTLYGTSFGDAIKIVIDTAENTGGFPPFGDCQVWPANPTYYPCETPSAIATWGTIVLGGNQPPVADAGGPYSGMVGESILLDGSGSYDLDGTIVSYEWDLDDDGFYDDATGSTTTNSWSFEGSYPISLKVTDDGGLNDTDDSTVSIGDHVVDGVINTGEYDGGVTVQLVGRTDPTWTVDAYIDWDSEYLYLAVNEPVPHYPTGSGLDWIEFGIDPTPSSPDRHIFGFFADGSQTYMGSLGSYTYLAVSSTATEFRIKYTDFGITEGDTIKMEIDRNDGTAIPPPPLHTYGFAAFWPEHAAVYAPDTMDSTTWGDVTLSPPADVPPVADVNGPYEDDNCDYTIDFDGSGSDDPDGTIVSYDWDFGDGTGWHNDLGATPPYTYSDFGEYTVNLRVTDNDGLTDTDTITAKVYGVVANANGPYEDSDCDDDYTIIFDGSGSTGYKTPLTYEWDFGDGTGWHNDLCAAPPYTYPNFGEYTVTLRVTESGNGCSDTDTATVKIYKVTANANGPYSSVDGSSVQFNSSGSSSCCGETLSYSWDFDDGNTSTLENPTHTYTSIGVYTVTLTVEGSVSHCTDDDTAPVLISSPPNQPTITGSNSGKAGVEYEYTFNAVDPDGDNVKYHIDWGDSNSETTTFSPSGTDVKVKHTWSTKGPYTIKATAEDTNGLVGPEGTLSVSMPKNRATQGLFLQILQNFLEQHPNLFPILRLLLGL